MIWNSVFAMTVIDLLIMGIAGCGLAYFLRVKNRGAKNQSIRGFGAINLGLMVIGGFFCADLLIMHALPHFVPRARAMAIMTEMHLNTHWPVSLAGIGLIGFGLVCATRQMLAMIDRFEASVIRNNHELMLREKTENWGQVQEGASFTSLPSRLCTTGVQALAPWIRQTGTVAVSCCSGIAIADPGCGAWSTRILRPEAGLPDEGPSRHGVRGSPW